MSGIVRLVVRSGLYQYLSYAVDMRPAPTNAYRQHHTAESVLFSDHDRIDAESVPESTGTVRLDSALLDAPRSSERARRKRFQNLDGAGKTSMFTI